MMPPRIKVSFRPKILFKGFIANDVMKLPTYIARGTVAT